jgi:hypothetical protein
MLLPWSFPSSVSGEAMAFNAFEQLEWVVPEPRQAFEDITAEMLTSTGRVRGRIRVNRGDGGVDYYCGTFGDQGVAEVYQAKYFPRPPWTSSQKQQIRNSYEAARNCADFKLSRWHLVVPSRPTKEDVRWFDEWALSLDVSATLIDGDDLVRILGEPACAPARKKLRDWGIIGIEDDGPVLEALLRVDPTEEKSGLAYIFRIILRNVGGRSANDLRVSIAHSETGCLAWQADNHFWADVGQGAVNPRKLAARESIHPGENVVVLSIPIARATAFPFLVKTKAWVRDGEPREQHLWLKRDQLNDRQLFQFSPGGGPEIAPVSEAIPNVVLAYPVDEMAEALLRIIAQHKNPDEYGITHILTGDPGDPARTMFLPSLARGGHPCGADSNQFSQGLNILLSTGWLEPAGENLNTCRYRLSSAARGDQRFLNLAEQRGASQE